MSDHDAPQIVAADAVAARALGADAHPLSGQFARSYYPAVFHDDRRDMSFTMTDSKGPVAHVPMTTGATEADYFGGPVRVFWRSSDDAVHSADRVVSELLARADGRRIRLVEERHPDEAVTPLGAACARSGLTSHPRRKAISDLTLTPEKRHAALRKSYRSLVNWGKRNLRIVAVDGAHQDRALFDAFRDFHARIAGRVTRGEGSWDAMYNWIVQGNGELTLAYEGEDIVAGTMVVDGAEWAYYASGVYDRERFDKPMGHWPLFNAVERAAGRGLRLFELGDVYEPGEASDKEVNIGKFKSGFATGVLTTVEWRSEPR